MPTCHIFIASSLDGFIAREDGAIDWLEERGSSDEDHGYEPFMAGIDAILMGRGTYEKVLEFEPWPYEKAVVVLSSTLAGSAVPERLAGKVRVVNLSPQAVLAMLHAEGCKRLYVDGGQLIQSFLREGLIEDMVLTLIPVLLGGGRKLFGALAADISLEHLSTTSFPSGLVQLHGTLRDRAADVLSPDELVRHHAGYRNRVLMGPSFRADVWTVLERAPELSVADVARRASCSFATAWQTAADFRLLREAEPLRGSR